MTNAFHTEAIISFSRGVNDFPENKEMMKQLGGAQIMDGSLNLGNSCGFFPTGWWNQNRVIAVTDIFESIVIPGKNKDLKKLVNCPDFYPIDAPYSHTFFYKIHASAFDGIVARNLEIQTKINLAITACAVERFRLKNNRLPDSIAELKAADLGVIRDDFYNPAGGPLQYRKDSDNGRYLLYSFGSHQIDNGGTSNPRSSDSPFSKVDRKTSDIVWRYSPPKTLKLKELFDSGKWKAAP